MYPPQLKIYMQIITNKLIININKIKCIQCHQKSPDICKLAVIREKKGTATRQ